MFKLTGYLNYLYSNLIIKSRLIINIDLTKSIFLNIFFGINLLLLLLFLNTIKMIREIQPNHLYNDKPNLSHHQFCYVGITDSVSKCHTHPPSLTLSVKVNPFQLLLPPTKDGLPVSVKVNPFQRLLPPTKDVAFHPLSLLLLSIHSNSYCHPPRDVVDLQSTEHFISNVL